MAYFAQRCAINEASPSKNRWHSKDKIVGCVLPASLHTLSSAGLESFASSWLDHLACQWKKILMGKCWSDYRPAASIDQLNYAALSGLIFIRFICSDFTLSLYLQDLFVILADFSAGAADMSAPIACRLVS